MKPAAFAVLILLASSPALHGAINQSCKAGSQDKSLLRVHGRLTVYNGGYPNLRLWQIGTRHMFGIFGDLTDLRCARGIENCKQDEDARLLPSNLAKLNLLDHFVYGDFEIRVLEPFEPGHMQAACIVDGRNLVIQR
jgi:hypothetical protein